MDTHVGTNLKQNKSMAVPFVEPLKTLRKFSFSCIGKSKGRTSYGPLWYQTKSSHKHTHLEAESSYSIMNVPYFWVNGVRIRLQDCQEFHYCSLFNLSLYAMVIIVVFSHGWNFCMPNSILLASIVSSCFLCRGAVHFPLQEAIGDVHCELEKNYPLGLLVVFPPKHLQLLGPQEQVLMSPRKRSSPLP